MVFINTTGFIGEIFAGFTTYVSGSVFMTLFAVFILFIGLMSMFRVPVEPILVLTLPMVLVFMAYSSGGFLAVGGTILIILGIILAKNWIVR